MWFGGRRGVLEAKPGNEKALPIQSSTLLTDIMSSLMGMGVSYETTSNSNEGKRIFKVFFFFLTKKRSKMPWNFPIHCVNICLYDWFTKEADSIAKQNKVGGVVPN